MKKYIKSAILTGACLAIAAAILPLTANSQVLRNQSRYSKAQVNQMISSLESSSNRFRRDFDRAMDRSSLNGTNTEDRYNREVAQYENALDQLRREFDRRDSWWETRSEVSSVIREAQSVNNIMNNVSFRRNLESQWNRMRNDLNKLADTFDLPGLNGGGWNGGPWNGGGFPGGANATRPPSWAVGTWYWVQGRDRSFTIDRNGIVTENAGGRYSQGTYSNGSLYLNGNRSTVTRTSRGIRTYNTATGETSDYTRSTSNGGGNFSRPPNWLLGTWTHVQDRAHRFTVEASGRVIENINGRISYGSYYNGIISLNGNNSSVTRTNNGIRTYNQSTGEVSNYFRR